MSGIVPRNIVRSYASTRPLLKRKRICRAPFNSLRFSLSGNIFACCYNRFHSLGKYPEVSIEQAWKGVQAELLRKKISANDLSSGCHSCYRDLMNRNFFAAGARIYDDYPVYEKGPSLMEFEITNKCNLECAMCNGENSNLIRKNREKAPPYPMMYNAAFIKQLIPFIPLLHEARFVGGEPFLEPLYAEMWETIAAVNPKTRISILTNGTILNEKILEMYRNHNVSISFSIDSVQKETYEKIRINADFETVMRNFSAIHDLSRRYKRGINVNLCPLRLNMYEIPDFINYFTAIEVPVVIHKVVYPPALSLSSLPEEELGQYAEFLEKSSIIRSHSVATHNDAIYQAFIMQVREWQSNAIENRRYIANPTPELMRKLSEKIMTVEGTETEVKNKCMATIEAILGDFDEQTRHKSLVSLLQIDPGYIIAETATSTHEKLKERVLGMLR